MEAEAYSQFVKMAEAAREAGYKVTINGDNGYRSYHMIVEVPVFFADRMRPIRVEVQIRTIAMDFWASLEHQLRYKKHLEIEDANALENELKECAETIAETDWRMLDLRQKIEEKGIIEKLDSWRNP